MKIREMRIVADLESEDDIKSFRPGEKLTVGEFCGKIAGLSLYENILDMHLVTSPEDVKF